MIVFAAHLALCTKNLGVFDFSQGYCENWCIQGPFLGFRWSKDDGKTWNEPRDVLKGDLVGKMGEPKNPVGEGAVDMECFFLFSKIGK